MKILYLGKNQWITLLCFLYAGIGIAQEQLSERQLKNLLPTMTEAQLVQYSTAYIIEEKLYLSDIISDRLLEVKPESANYQYRKGYTLLRSKHNYEGALVHFLAAIKDIDNNYDMFSHKEKSAPADAYFYLASCYHLNEEIEKAEVAYQQFIDLSKKKSELIKIAQHRLVQCSVAKKLISNPTSAKIENIGTPVNSAAPEISPVVAPDGSAIYFTSRRNWLNGETLELRDPINNLPPEDVYVTFKDFENSWTEPTRLHFCQPARNEATSSVSTDERKIYLYLDSTGLGDIYYNDFYKEDFDEVEKMAIEKINTEFWETHCMKSDNGQRIYFVSDRPDGFGGRDIYYCTILPNGTWSSPINAGPEINTEYDEEAPFISIENRTLYFASNGTKSMGGFDIFRTILREDGTWTQAENLGCPFNSTDDDIFYTSTTDGLMGYMTTIRKNGKGEKDIYEIKNDYLGVQNVTVLRGNIVDSKGKTLPQNVEVVVRVSCLNCENKAPKIVYPRARDGFYLSGLEPCRDYLIEYQNVTIGKELYRDSFKTACGSAYQEIQRKLYVNNTFTEANVLEESPVETSTVAVVESPVPVKEMPTFNDLEFKQYLGFNKDKFVATEGELNVYLKKIEKQLAEGRQKVVIEIYASASTVPTASFKTNELLAQKRAENVKNTLVSYFASSKFRDRIDVQILEALVQGPAYDGDYANEPKYGPYQYVQLKMK